MTILKGLTWNNHWHTDTIAALSNLFEVNNPDSRIEWCYRSLDAYHSELFSANVNHYDIVLFKNLHMASIISTGILMPLEDIIHESTMNNLKKNAVGNSFKAYAQGGHQYGLPFTVTSLVGAYRADLMENLGMDVPKTWMDVLRFCKALPNKMRVMMSLKPWNLYDAFRCYIGGFHRGHAEAFIIGETEVSEALAFFEELIHYIDPSGFHMSMLELYSRMSSVDDIVYTPMIIGNANYSKDGYRKNLIDFCDIPAHHEQVTNGIFYSSGLGITIESKHKDMAADFLRMITSKEVQDHMIVDFDGHPLYKERWFNKENNQKTNRYFINTYESVNHAVNPSVIKGDDEKRLEIGTVIWHYLKSRKVNRPQLVKALTQLMNTYEKQIIWH